MTTNNRASYERTHNIACFAARNMGIDRGSGLAADTHAINRAVKATMIEAGCSRATAQKHVFRYIHNLPAPRWGVEPGNRNWKQKRKSE